MPRQMRRDINTDWVNCGSEGKGRNIYEGWEATPREGGSVLFNLTVLAAGITPGFTEEDSKAQCPKDEESECTRPNEEVAIYHCILFIWRKLDNWFVEKQVLVQRQTGSKRGFRTSCDHMSSDRPAPS